jgi:hypothetical protein
MWDAATHTVTLTLIAGYNLARRGFNFNGYSTGTMVISVPRGARVRVIFRNQGRFPHSAIEKTLRGLRPSGRRGMRRPPTRRARAWGDFPS